MMKGILKKVLSAKLVNSTNKWQKSLGDVRILIGVDITVATIYTCYKQQFKSNKEKHQNCHILVEIGNFTFKGNIN